MKKRIQVKNIADLSRISHLERGREEMVYCARFEQADVLSVFSEEMFLNASTAILVLSGQAKLVANYAVHEVGSYLQPSVPGETAATAVHSVLLLSPSHLFRFIECSADFSCVTVFVSRKFMDEMDSTDMIYKRIKYGVRLFNTPVVELKGREPRQIQRRLEEVARVVADTGHLYYRDMILNALIAFYLDLSHLIDSRTVLQSETGHITRYESIMNGFLERLVNHYHREHKVDFYASQLNISAHYLTLIVKRITGQSASDFIFEMLYGEARNLLAHSRLSVQEIATALNFSDQSAFGKFFKRRAGVSPADYRKLP